MFVRDDYVAYCVNEYVFAFSSWVNSELDKLKRGKKEKEEPFKNRRDQRLKELLGDDSSAPSFPQKFANPIAMTKRE